MKPKSINTIMVAALLAPGALFAQTTAKTTPVGYETITLSTGFNYVGLRLHQPVVFAGTFETVNNTTLVDTGAAIQPVLTSGATYLVEIVDGAGVGAVAEILGSSVAGDTISTNNSFTALGVTAGAKYLIRPADTLASVFGATNSAGLKGGDFGPTGADVIFVPDGLGGFNQYYYDDSEVGWFRIADPVESVTPSDVPLVYLDSMIISSTGSGATSLVVDGEVKTKAVYHMVTPGFNYIGSVYPAGATLETAFGDPATIATLDKGSFGPTDADVFFVPNGGAFDQYYYDDAEGGWFKIADPVESVLPSSVSLPSGLIFSNFGSSFNLKDAPPAYYSTL